VGNDAQRSLLLGMYMGQIKARIDRAWARPRVAVGGKASESFSCQVEIAQDSNGYVTEVTLVHCNGNAHWQQSLVSGIQSASPLPAPPDPSLFASQLRLSFDATAFVTGGPEQGFEPEALAMVVTWPTIAVSSATAAPC
jgi:hypothetical protein